MSEFDSEEYWEAEQISQYEREIYKQQCRDQEELEYIQFAQHCLEIANGWLLGDLSEDKAIEALMYVGEEGCERTLLEWSEEVLKGL